MIRPEPTAASIVAACLERGLTIGTAESLTAGLIASSLAEVPGCSGMLRGGVVAYHADLKRDLLGVPASSLSAGLVSRAVAVAMAEGAARVLAADLGVGATGVAGPDPHDGQQPGSVWIAVCGPGVSLAAHLTLSGDRERVRRETVAACWGLVVDALSQIDRLAEGGERGGVRE